jgi:hypothetical protein
MRTAKRPFTIAVLLLSVMLLAGACGSSNDPETWAEAEQDGRLRENFQAACVEANGEEGAAVEFTDAQIAAYCECAFVEIVEYFGGSINGDNELDDVADAVAGRDFQAFRDLESDLRDDPTQIPADIEAFLDGCAQNV